MCRKLEMSFDFLCGMEVGEYDGKKCDAKTRIVKQYVLSDCTSVWREAIVHFRTVRRGLENKCEDVSVETSSLYFLKYI